MTSLGLRAFVFCVRGFTRSGSPAKVALGVFTPQYTATVTSVANNDKRDLTPGRPHLRERQRKRREFSDSLFFSIAFEFQGAIRDRFNPVQSTLVSKPTGDNAKAVNDGLLSANESLTERRLVWERPGVSLTVQKLVTVQNISGTFCRIGQSHPPRSCACCSYRNGPCLTLRPGRTSAHQGLGADWRRV